ncbi:MAG: hypothetical protein DRR08_18725 [Candidatus Parabeggiatoa sp. nov. 2]|nr:MAG: hypothetical protein DRR08_18725 [Gammaproteobacteria bacterium]HEC83761.1 hypothetical protein [Thioploca sp.]
MKLGDCTSKSCDHCARVEDVEEETIHDHGPLVKGDYWIKVQDVTGNTAQAQVNVYSTKLFASPKTLCVHHGETLKIAIGGGTKSYELSANLGKLADRKFTF